MPTQSAVLVLPDVLALQAAKIWHGAWPFLLPSQVSVECCSAAAIAMQAGCAASVFCALQWHGVACRVAAPSGTNGTPGPSVRVQARRNDSIDDGLLVLVPAAPGFPGLLTFIEVHWSRQQLGVFYLLVC